MYIYHTEINKSQVKTIDKVLETLEKQLTLGYLDRFPTMGENLYRTDVDNHSLPHWVHPVVYEDKVFGDARPFLSSKGTVNNKLDLAFLKARATVTLKQWETPNLFEYVSAQLTTVFSNWISAGIVQRFGATVNDDVTYKIVAAAYYAKLIMEHTEFTMRLKQGDNSFVKRGDKMGDMSSSDFALFVIRLLGSRGMGLPSTFVSEVLDDGILDTLTKPEDGYVHVGTLADLINEVSVTNLGDFNKSTLIRIMAGGSWQGYDAANMSVSAMESPLILTAMVGYLSQVPAYKNKTRIGRVCNSLSRKVDLVPLTSMIIN